MSAVKGRRRENYIKQKLKEKGFDLVVRSAGSKGPADLIAISLKKREIWFIQVKGPGDTASPSELEELAQLEGTFKVRALVIYKAGMRYVRHEIKRVGKGINALIPP